MQRLLLPIISTLLVSFASALSAANNLIVQQPSISQRVILTNATLMGRHPCAVDSVCRCFRNGRQFKQVVVYCAKRNLTKTHQLLNGVRVVYLELAENAIEQMPDMTRHGYQFVKILVLSHNRIRTINENSISMRLQMLLLEDNLITRVDEKVINKIHASKLWWFTLHHNPLICDCDSVPWVKFVQQGKKKDFCLGPQWTTCVNTNTLLTNLNVEELCSNGTTIMTPSTYDHDNSSVIITKEDRRR